MKEPLVDTVDVKTIVTKAFPVLVSLCQSVTPH